MCVVSALLLAGCGGSSQGPVMIHSKAELREALSKMSPAERAEIRVRQRIAEDLLRSEPQPPSTRGHGECVRRLKRQLAEQRRLEARYHFHSIHGKCA